MNSYENCDKSDVKTPLANADLNTSLDITQSGCEPIKILLFPPKNKQFRFDEQSKCIEIEPLETKTNESANETTLTPLVESFNIQTSTPVTEETPFENYDNQLRIKQLLQIKNVFLNTKLKNGCFLKGCKWSGDGLCLLSNSEDNVLRVFEINNMTSESLDDLEPVLQMKEGGIIYDYAWYPKMSSSDPVSCVFASTSQNSPIHLWDAYTGMLRATYQPINQYDEVTSAYSLSFTPDGSKIYSGFKKCLRIFDISLPGRQSEERNLKNKGNPFQTNIISTISINPLMPSLYALGSYDKTVGIYTEPEGELLCILKGHRGGITQIMFSTDGNYLFSGGRKDDEILCWDVRNPGKVVFSIMRKVETQQKILFDLLPDMSYLITGSTDGSIGIFDLKNQNEKILEPWMSFVGHEDCVNGVQFHPNVPIFASSSDLNDKEQLSLTKHKGTPLREQSDSENRVSSSTGKIKEPHSSKKNFSVFKKVLHEIVNHQIQSDTHMPKSHFKDQEKDIVQNFQNLQLSEAKPKKSKALLKATEVFSGVKWQQESTKKSDSRMTSLNFSNQKLASNQSGILVHLEDCSFL